MTQTMTQNQAYGPPQPINKKNISVPFIPREFNPAKHDCIKLYT